MALPTPPLLEDRSPAMEMVLLVALPSGFGIICGFFLGVSEPLYLVLSLLGILGGLGAGFEHDGWREGFYRGLIGGLQFGVWILLTSAITGAEPKAKLPEPEIYLVAITTVLGVILGSLGGRARAKREHEAAPA